MESTGGGNCAQSTVPPLGWLTRVPAGKCARMRCSIIRLCRSSTARTLRMWRSKLPWARYSATAICVGVAQQTLVVALISNALAAWRPGSR